jgi:chloramphenicol 3-O phosphotransferase
VDRPHVEVFATFQIGTTVVGCPNPAINLAESSFSMVDQVRERRPLAHSLQGALHEPWLLLGIDLLIWTLPPDLMNDPNGLVVRDGVIVRGEVFMALYRGFQEAVAALAGSGVDVLLDDVALDGAADQQRWNDALKDLEVFWIGVRCDPEIAAERESLRQSRLPGVAARQAVSVHSGVQYDVEVDTGLVDLAEEVRTVAESLNRRWALQLSPRSDAGPALPPTSAWAPGEALRPPPWET